MGKAETGHELYAASKLTIAANSRNTRVGLSKASRSAPPLGASLGAAHLDPRQGETRGQNHPLACPDLG